MGLRNGPGDTRGPTTEEADSLSLVEWSGGPLSTPGPRPVVSFSGETPVSSQVRSTFLCPGTGYPHSRIR